VGANAITGASVAWVSEDANGALFNVQFTYQPNPTSSDTATATGTVSFDKVNGTYSVELNAPIDSFSITSTSHATSFTGYDLESSVLVASNPPVSVAKLATNFYVQFSGQEEGTLTAPTIQPGTTFVNGDVFATGVQTYVTISNASNGVHGDTMQRGEILDLDFFASDPQGFINSPPTAQASAIFLKFDGIGTGEDLVVVLKLVDPDDHTHTTKAIVVDNGDIYKTNAEIPVGYQGSINLDSNDGAVIIESNDYNTSVGENWVIEGAQVLVSSRNITGTGIDLNSTSANGGASTGTQPLETGETGSGEPVKISDIGFVSVTTGTQTTNLNFALTTVADADGDPASIQNLNVSIVAGTTFAGTSTDEAIQGSPGNDTLIGGGGNDILVGGGGADTFKWTAGDHGTDGSPSIDTIKDFGTSGTDVLDLREMLVGETHAGTDPGNLGTFLDFSFAGGNTTITVKSSGAGTGDAKIVLLGVDLTAGNTLSEGQIITNLLTQNKLIAD
jgi:hypothetical protein